MHGSSGGRVDGCLARVTSPTVPGVITADHAVGRWTGVGRRIAIRISGIAIIRIRDDNVGCIWGRSNSKRDRDRLCPNILSRCRRRQAGACDRGACNERRRSQAWREIIGMSATPVLRDLVLGAAGPCPPAASERGSNITVPPIARCPLSRSLLGEGAKVAMVNSNAWAGTKRGEPRCRAHAMRRVSKKWLFLRI